MFEDAIGKRFFGVEVKVEVTRKRIIDLGLDIVKKKEKKCCLIKGRRYTGYKYLKLRYL